MLTSKTHVVVPIPECLLVFKKYNIPLSTITAMCYDCWQHHDSLATVDKDEFYIRWVDVVWDRLNACKELAHLPKVALALVWRTLELSEVEISEYFHSISDWTAVGSIQASTVPGPYFNLIYHGGNDVSPYSIYRAPQHGVQS